MMRDWTSTKGIFIFEVRELAQLTQHQPRLVSSRLSLWKGKDGSSMASSPTLMEGVGFVEVEGIEPYAG